MESVNFLRLQLEQAGGLSLGIGIDVALLDNNNEAEEG